MYREVIALARKYNLGIIENRKSSKIAGYICLDEQGRYQGFECLDDKEQKECLIPDFGAYSRVEKQPNPICEKAMYILNLKSGKNDGTKKYPYWVKTMETGKDACDSLKCLWNFIQKFDEDEDFANQVVGDVQSTGLKIEKVISFKIDGVPVESMDDWNLWLLEKIVEFDKAKGRDKDKELVFSSITGELQEAFPEKSGPMIQNVPNDIKGAFGLGSGVYVASMKESSYQSYGMQGATGTQMGLKDAKDFAAGMEYLLSNEYSRNEKKVIYSNCNKTFQVVFWYEDDVPNLLMGSLLLKDLKDDVDLTEQDDDDVDDEYEDMLNASGVSEILSACYNTSHDDKKNGGVPVKLNSKNPKYHMAKFVVPNRGRFYLSDIRVGSYNDLVQNLFKFYDDTKLIYYRKGVANVFIIRSIYAMLCNCVKQLASDGNGKVSESVCKELGSLEMPLLDTMYEGKQLPERLYRIAISKVVNGVVTSVPDRIVRIWMSMIKLYLVRKGVNVMPECSSNVSPAYACGKLFAVYCKLQRDYNSGRKVNRPLEQIYFSTVVKRPMLVFPTVVSLGNTYLAGLRKDSKKEKWAIFYEKLMKTLSEEIGNTFPVSLDIAEQGSFILGYYQQLGSFYEKSDKETDSEDVNDSQSMDDDSIVETENVESNEEEGI